MNRIVTLDYLRGLCAFSIMIYHYLGFLGYRFETDFMGRVGIYGVSIFYILSGLTLYLVYKDRFNVADFYIKRFFRIFPLMWVVMALSIIIWRLAYSYESLLINFSGLFGLLSWWNAFGMGVWSIGNELVFYLLFPVLLIASRRDGIGLVYLSFLILSIYTWFAFVELTPSNSLVDQWKVYTNPLNQAGLFAIGVLIGRFTYRIEVNNVVASGFILTAIALFLFFPLDGPRIEIVTGFNRLIFTLASTLLCFGFYKLNLSTINRPLSMLGESSYSLYLLHPIIWAVYHRMFPISPVSFVICLILSLSISYGVYLTFEMFFIKIGKRVHKSVFSGIF
jgi:exopolysaccharide production protein ExoZ